MVQRAHRGVHRYWYSLHAMLLVLVSMVLRIGTPSRRWCPITGAPTSSYTVLVVWHTLPGGGMHTST